VHILILSKENGTGGQSNAKQGNPNVHISFRFWSWVFTTLRRTPATTSMHAMQSDIVPGSGTTLVAVNEMSDTVTVPGSPKLSKVPTYHPNTEPALTAKFAEVTKPPVSVSVSWVKF
jgi:hypothetical protein